MISYCFFDRNGGVSRDVFASLNVSYRLGDAPERVEENRRRIKERLGATRLVSAGQVHGDIVHAVVGRPAADVEIPGCDALVTAETDVALLIQQADCQAVLLHDPVRRVIAAIHCGWRGSVAGIIGTTVAACTGRYGCVPADMRAYIGPSLGPCCAEFVHFKRELPPSFQRFQVRPAYFDFWEISSRQLVEAGLRPERLAVARICTSCSEAYFSYRRACRESDGTTGRHGSAIVLCSGNAPRG